MFRIVLGTFWDGVKALTWPLRRKALFGNKFYKIYVVIYNKLSVYFTSRSAVLLLILCFFLLNATQNVLLIIYSPINTHLFSNDSKTFSTEAVLTSIWLTQQGHLKIAKQKTNSQKLVPLIKFRKHFVIWLMNLNGKCEYKFNWPLCWM